VDDAPTRRKRSRRRRKPKSRSKVEPVSDNGSLAGNANAAKKHHDAPMTKRDLYFSLQCDMVGIGHGASAVARLTLLNWECQMVLDSFVQVPVPVTDYRRTGITPQDLNENPLAMSFAQARQALERILRGKILIGHGVDAHLVALGLTHPRCDVRDTASRFVSHELDPLTGKPVGVPKGLSDLSLEFLKRPISGDERQRPLENCMAALDLYKTFRSEWEQDLIQKTRPAEAPVYQPMPPQQPMYHPGRQHGQVQVQQQRPQRPRLPSYELPPQAMMLQTGYTPAETLESQQAQAPVSNYQAAMQTRNSSWFGRGRKQRYPQPSPAAAAAALSPQAMQVLSDHGVQSSDHESAAASHHYEGSSYNEGSIRDAASNDYASSAYTGSFASESVASAQEEQEAYEETSNKESSWFRFTRKSKYPPQQRTEQHLMALEESEDPEDSAALTEPASESQNQEQQATESAPYYEPPKYFESDVPGGKSSKSSWFGFRSKSPGFPKPHDSMPKIDEPEEPDTPVEEPPQQLSVESSPVDNTSDRPDEQSFYSDPSPQEGRGSPEKQSSAWFVFRRSKSPSRSKSRESSMHGGGDMLPSQVTIPNPSSGVNDEDWLHEVITQPGNEDVKNDHLSDFGSWIEDQQHEENEAQEGQPSSRDSQSQSTWFRFLRKESTSRKVSRLTGISDDAEGSSQNLTADANLEYFTQPAPSFDESQNDEDWLEEVVAPVDSSCLSPAWFGFREAEAPMDVPPPTQVSQDGSVKQFDFFLRNRLCTESTLPTVASDDIEEQDQDHLLQDFEHGMENNFNFLNI
jgi:RNA exonuclease 4